ncbi:TPA: hypothetical protein U1273_000459 [Streptococcus suis]|nr:hypothetical protein [Streptococcus suis]
MNMATKLFFSDGMKSRFVISTDLLVEQSGSGKVIHDGSAHSHGIIDIEANGANTKVDKRMIEGELCATQGFYFKFLFLF